MPRLVGFRSARLAAVIDACRSGWFRAVLPVALGKHHHLRALPGPRIAGSQLFMCRRQPLHDSPIEAYARKIAAQAKKLA